MNVEVHVFTQQNFDLPTNWRSVFWLLWWSE